MFKKIIADFAQKDERLNVLFLCLAPSHYNDALIMAKHSPFNCFIFTPLPERYIIESKLEGVKIVRDTKNCLAILLGMDRLVVPFSIIAPGYWSGIKKILALAVRSEIPIINVPHGMFEPGKNMVDTSAFINSSSQVVGLGGKYRSFADRHLVWCGEGMEIGYPHTMLKEQDQERIFPSYTLITTNSNWYLYSFEDRRRLFLILFSFIENHPERFFIWAPHPAEVSENNMYARIAKSRRPQNLFIYGIHEDIYFNGVDTTEQLIHFCENGISTTTTCLMDFELQKKPVHVFECDGTKALTDSMQQVSYFGSVDDLERPAKQVVTGCLKEYRPDLFEKYIKEATITQGKERAYFLEMSALPD